MTTQVYFFCVRQWGHQLANLLHSKMLFLVQYLWLLADPIWSAQISPTLAFETTKLNIDVAVVQQLIIPQKQFNIYSIINIVK